MTPKKQGLFASFEGGEGAGKSTVIRALADELRATGLKVVVTREPGGCPIADQIRTLLKDPASPEMVGRTEMLLFAAARAQHVGEVIRPGLQRGAIVLCDRYADSTFAYQGFGRGVDLDLLARLHTLATDDLQPDVTFWLDGDAETLLTRAHGRNAETQDVCRFDSEKLAFHQRVREGYRALDASEERFVRIDAERSPEQVLAQVREAFLAHLRSCGLAA